MWAAGAAASCKTQFIRRLLARLVAEGHRTLLFSQSRVMLDVIGRDLAARGVAFLRIDGTIASAAERQACFRVPSCSMHYAWLCRHILSLGRVGSHVPLHCNEGHDDVICAGDQPCAACRHACSNSKRATSPCSYLPARSAVWGSR